MVLIYRYIIISNAPAAVLLESLAEYPDKEKISFDYNYSGGKSVTYKHRFSGVINYVNHYFDKTSSVKIREWAESFMTTKTCESCNGGRLKIESLSVLINDKNISDLAKLDINELRKLELKLHAPPQLASKTLSLNNSIF